MEQPVHEIDVAEVHVFQGDEAVLRVTEAVLEIASRLSIVELAYDPWRYSSEALRLEREHGLVVVDFPQSHARMTAASESLHAAIVEQRLTHPDDSELNRHVAAAVAKSTGRGWRLDKGERAAQIDAVVALAMAVERAQTKPEPVRFLALDLMPLRPCLGCKRLTRHGSYCPGCRPKSPSSAATDRPGWTKLRAQVRERDGHRCRGCGAMGRLSVHHVMRVAEGGRNELSNLVLVCESCHRDAHR